MVEKCANSKDKTKSVNITAIKNSVWPKIILHSIGDNGANSAINLDQNATKSVTTQDADDNARNALRSNSRNFVNSAINKRTNAVIPKGPPVHSFEQPSTFAFIAEKNC